MSNRTVATNTNLSESKGGGNPTSTDEHAKATAGSVTPVVSVSGNAIQIHADCAIWDTVANKFLNTNDVKRNG